MCFMQHVIPRPKVEAKLWVQRTHSYRALNVRPEFKLFKSEVNLKLSLQPRNAWDNGTLYDYNYALNVYNSIKLTPTLNCNEPNREGYKVWNLVTSVSAWPTLVLASIRSLARWLLGERGLTLLCCSLHHSRCRSYALGPKLRSQYGHCSWSDSFTGGGGAWPGGSRAACIVCTSSLCFSLHLLWEKQNYLYIVINQVKGF